MSEENEDDDFILDQTLDDNLPAMFHSKEVDTRQTKKYVSSNQIPSKSMQRQMDDNKWEENLLFQSGALSKTANITNFEDDESENRVYLKVNTSRPDFLVTYDASKFQEAKVDKRYNLEGEIYQLAKEESQSVVEWRKKKEREALTKDIVQSDKRQRIENQNEIKISEIEARTAAQNEYRNFLGGKQVINKGKLPIFDAREQILKVVAENNVVVIVGETGSGKTTQLTQFFYEEGYSKFGQIICTQPRRVAAVSVAKRVADEMGVELGTLVGYTIRFEDVTDETTEIKYMTDGILLREALLDEELKKCSVIIMDEAHERSLNTDVLFGVLKKVLQKRRDLKVIVTSATMNAEKFSAYFGDAPIFHIKGRHFKVEPFFMRSNPTDYVYEAVRQACSIHLKEPPGDILVFMTGQDDVECTCALIREQLNKVDGEVPELRVLPIYSQLPADQQAKVFEFINVRKCVVATNIAETSLTIDGIRYVIDCGFCKQKSHSSRAGLSTLLKQPVSQAAAIQRRGRAGRTSEGKCWHLFSETSFKYEMLPDTIPEVQRTNLANVILLLKSMGFEDVLSFDFMDKPPVQNFLNALTQLWFLRALNDDGKLTRLGYSMVMFPLDPMLSKMILVGHRYGCLEEVLTIVSMLSVPPVFFKPKGREEEADAMREKFLVPESDHLTLLNIYRIWSDVGKHRPTVRERDAERIVWCKKHFLHHVNLTKAYEVRKQIVDIARAAGLEFRSVGPANWDIVRKAVCSAYFHQVARQNSLNEYYNLHTSVQCFIHPSSALAGQAFMPEYIVYNELVYTSKNYLHNVTAVDPLWLSQMAPEFFTAHDAHGNEMEEGKPNDNEAAEDLRPFFAEHEKEEKEETEKSDFISPTFQPLLHLDVEHDKVVVPPEIVNKKRKKMGR